MLLDVDLGSAVFSHMPPVSEVHCLHWAPTELLLADAALYELQKNWYCEYTGRDEPGVLASLLFGGLS